MVRGLVMAMVARLREVATHVAGDDLATSEPCNRELVVTAAELADLQRRATPSTADDVSITADGRRLDSPAKVIEFVDELNWRLADPADLDLDLD